MIRAEENARQIAANVQNDAEELQKAWNSDAYLRSAQLFNEASKNWKIVGDFQKATYCLRESARLNISLGNRPEALAALNEALRIDQQNNLKDETILDLSLLSRLQNQAGDIDKSKKNFQKALELADVGASDLARAEALFAAGEHNFNHISIAESHRLFEEALTLVEGAGATELRARIQLNLGISMAIDGKKDPALNKVFEARDYFLNTGNQRGQALASNGLGFIYTISNEKQKALQNYEMARNLFPEDLDLIDRGKTFTGIASLYYQFGQNELSNQNWRKALETFQKSGSLYGQLAVLPYLARFSYQRGNQTETKKLYDLALALSDKLNNKILLASFNIQLGLIDYDEGNYDRAVERYQKALLIYKNFGIAQPSLINYLGKAIEKQGDLDQARRYFEESLKICRETKDTINSPENLYDLARLSKKEGDLTGALEKIEESLAITESFYYDVDNGNLRSSFLSSVYERYELYINVLMKMHQRDPAPGFDIKALQAAEKTRSRSTREMIRLTEANFTKDADPEILKRKEEIIFTLNSKADRLTDLLNAGGSPDEINRFDKEVRQLKNDLEGITAELKQKSPVYSEIENPTPFNPKAFQEQVLDENTLLLEYSLGTEESYLWVIGKTEITSFVLPPRPWVEEKVTELRQLLTSQAMQENETLEDYQKREQEIDSTYWKKSEELRVALLGQIENRLTDQKLIIVPDGKLALFPFSALPRPGSTEPLVLNHQIIYEPSASTLSLILETGKTNNTKPVKDLIVFSDPIFKSDDSRLTNTGNAAIKNPPDLENSFRFVQTLNDLARLESSGIEAASIIEIIGSSRSDLFDGFSANREQFLNLPKGNYKIMHFATHGLVDEERPELSGIVLSRFDKEGRRLNELIRLQDIYGLNLNTDLVILSACNTGVGKEIKGEGLASLNNAFLQVGARSVMSSFWKVEDSATVELMKVFYENLARENMTPSRALQQAQIRMWQSGRYNSPFFWAAFHIEGDFKRIPDLNPGGSPFRFALIPLLVVGVLAAVFWFYRRKSYSTVNE